MTNPSLKTRVRIPVQGTESPAISWRQIAWRPDRTAAIICDMWDKLACASAARRGAALAIRINDVVDKLRSQGVLIIHAPSACMDFYRHTPARQRALNAPAATASVPFDWNAWDPTREAPLPMAMDDSEPCSCDPSRPRCVEKSARTWTRQTPTIQIADQDAISDDGQEAFNLLTHHGIDLIVLMGVHANRCLLGRPFGIRQLVYLGMNPILCRDLTDSYHREPGGHGQGTNRIVEHIERYWCPSVTSDQLIGGPPFRLDDALTVANQRA